MIALLFRKNKRSIFSSFFHNLWYTVQSCVPGWIPMSNLSTQHSASDGLSHSWLCILYFKNMMSNHSNLKPSDSPFCLSPAYIWILEGINTNIHWEDRAGYHIFQQWDCGGCVWSVCCWYLVYSLTWPESDWLDSGWVGLHTWGAWAIMAPRINQLSTHTRGGATVTAACNISSANTTCSPINILNYHLPVSCVGGPQGRPLRWRVARSDPATETKAEKGAFDCTAGCRPAATKALVCVGPAVSDCL